MTDSDTPFSQRHGVYREPPVTVRDAAPVQLRLAIVELAHDVGIPPLHLRKVVLRTLRVPPNPQRLKADDNVLRETGQHLTAAKWYEVYDVVEALASSLDPHRLRQFESDFNDYCRRNGIGWHLQEGKLTARGEETFETALVQAKQALDKAGLPTARAEIHEALTDLSRRPDPDLTGAIQHALAALECVAREAAGDSKATLGQLLDRYPDLLPKPLDAAVEKLWGFASEMGRHVREGRSPDRADAELVVSLAGAVSTYLAQKVSRKS